MECRITVMNGFGIVDVWFKLQKMKVVTWASKFDKNAIVLCFSLLEIRRDSRMGWDCLKQHLQGIFHTTVWKAAMDARKVRWCCQQEMERLERDLLVHHRLIRHVNKKVMNLKASWEIWSGREEESRVRECHAQTGAIHALSIEFENLKLTNMHLEQKVR